MSRRLLSHHKAEHEFLAESYRGEAAAAGRANEELLPDRHRSPVAEERFRIKREATR